MCKRIIAAIMLCLLTLSISSCSGDVIFTHAELTLVFPKGFHEGEKSDNADLTVTNGELSAAITRFSFMNEDIPANLTVEDFAEYFLEKTNMEYTVYSYKDLAYYTYYASDGASRLFCTATFYRTPYSYFYVLYATDASLEASWREEILKIADTATFNFKGDVD